MNKKWLFNIKGNLYSKELPFDTLQELNSFLLTHKEMSGFIELDNVLVNINHISQICDADDYKCGKVYI